MVAFCDPAGARTQDPNIKSVVLYQLSYGIILLIWECKFNTKTVSAKKSLSKLVNFTPHLLQL